MAKKKVAGTTPPETSTHGASQSEQKVQSDLLPAAAPTTTPETHPPPATQAASLASLKKLMSAWRARHRPPPAILYHYTNAQGLQGMISTGHVWGTNVGFLNDPSEMRYAAQLIRNVMSEEVERLKTEQPTDEKKNFWQRMVDAYAENMSKSLPSYAESLLKSFEDQGDVYMTCFCTKGDLLSQWRGYGSTGSGYALGFEARQMGARAKPADGVRLRRVIYKVKEQEEIIRNWVRAFFDLGQSLVKAMDEQASLAGPTDFLVQLLTMFGGVVGMMQRAATNKQLLEQAKQIFTKFLAECLICFKDPAYEQEQEWRVIQFVQNVEIKFRASGARLVPYVELGLMAPTDGNAPVRLPLKSITYGPTLEPGVTEKSLNMLLKRYQYPQSEIEIKRSGIPLRRET